MGTYTTNLNLYNTDMNTDGNDTFDFQRDLNDNNDKIDAFAGKVSIKNYLSNDTYQKDDVVMSIIDNEVKMYKSLIANNTGNALTNNTKWEKVNLGGAQDIGEYCFSSLPITNANKHLLDGTVLSNSGIYKEFVNYIADLYTENPNANYFCTETEWQASVLQYGSCGKYVYDSTLNTVRLPQVSDIIQCTTDLTALGNLIEAGLPDHTHTYSAPNRYNDTDRGTNASKWSIDDVVEFTSSPASDSNPIYGNNTTVQPQTIQGLVYVVIATSSKTDIQVDIDEIATDLNNKVDKSTIWYDSTSQTLYIGAPRV